MKTIEINSLQELHTAARTFISMTRGMRKFAFHGLMGSGKTTLIKAICEEMGATGIVTSPTFALINEYYTTFGEVLYHFDLYRINSPEELYDLGYEEYFYGDAYLFIEWAEKAEALLPDSFIRVTVEEIDSHKRLIRIAV